MSITVNKMQSRDDAYLPCDPLERRRVVSNTVGESRTRQADALSCDINHIVNRFHRTGMLPPARHQGAYADVTRLQGDLTEKAAEARKTITKADEVVKTVRKRKADASKSPAKAPSSDATPTPTVTPPEA